MLSQMITYDAVMIFINDLLEAEEIIILIDFVHELQERFYPHQDISFMEYFLELAKRTNEYKFIVPHTKLIEYGITTAGQSSNNIKNRLNALGLVKDVDYLPQKFLQQLPSGAKHSIMYNLTPRSFKKALMRASKHKTHKIDVTQYADYYLFLETAVSYYSEYQTGLLNLKEKDIREKEKKLRKKKRDLKRMQTKMRSTQRKSNQTVSLDPTPGITFTEITGTDDARTIACVGGPKHSIEDATNKRNIAIEFNPIANPIDYCNAIVVQGNEALRQASIRENERRMDEYNKLRSIYNQRLIDARARKAELKAADEMRFQEAVSKRNNNYTDRKTYNQELRAEISESNKILKKDIEEHNRKLPRGSTEKRSLTTDSKYRKYNDEFIRTEEDFQMMQADEPIHEDFVSTEELERLSECIRRNKKQLKFGEMPRIIDERHIPVVFGKYSYQWNKNPFFSYNEFLSVIKETIATAQATSKEAQELKEFDGLYKDEPMKEMLLAVQYNPRDATE